jgi:flagella basal body P-ring formation protein FlgA
MVRSLAMIFALICLTAPSKLIAETGLSGKSVKEAIQRTLTLNNISATPIINEKKLFPKCANKLSINPSHGNWKTVSVKCEGNAPWKITVRNKFSVPAKASTIANSSMPKTQHKIRLFDKVKVAAISRSIRRGDVITPEDVTEIKIPVNKATDIFPDYRDLIGRRAKTTIKALTPVFSRQLETNFMIEENMKVTIIHHGQHISVQTEGVALENGQYGDWINVKNSKSGRIILAKVIAEKKVTI